MRERARGEISEPSDIYGSSRRGVFDSKCEGILAVRLNARGEVTTSEFSVYRIKASRKVSFIYVVVIVSFTEE